MSPTRYTTAKDARPTLRTTKPDRPDNLDDEYDDDGDESGLEQADGPDASIQGPPIDDAKKYARFERVPILDAHDHPEKGRVDKALLNLIAENSNKRAEKGNYALILIGHTKDDGPETDAPPLVGFGRNFVVGRFHDRPCLLADLHVRKEQVEDALKFPHRSVERMKSKKHEAYNYIDAISLLRRPPERDLGLLTYSRSTVPGGAQLVRYARDLPSLGATTDAAPTYPLRSRKVLPMADNDYAEFVQVLVPSLIRGLVPSLTAEIRAMIEELATDAEPEPFPEPEDSDYEEGQEPLDGPEAYDEGGADDFDQVDEDPDRENYRRSYGRDVHGIGPRGDEDMDPADVFGMVRYARENNLTHDPSYAIEQYMRLKRSGRVR